MRYTCEKVWLVVGKLITATVLNFQIFYLILRQRSQLSQSAQQQRQFAVFVDHDEEEVSRTQQPALFMILRRAFPVRSPDRPMSLSRGWSRKIGIGFAAAFAMVSWRWPSASSLQTSKRKPSSTTIAQASTATTRPILATSSATPATKESRLRAALWSFFAGDALSSPTHWYYGGAPQIQRDYGKAGITDYTRPVHDLPGSILNKSNLNGGGRRQGSNGGTTLKTVVGDVILHGKQDLWSPRRQVHYHATLQAGEMTLEGQLGRVLMKSIVTTGGVFDANHFRQAYIEFMTRPGSHNDTYASTCHRMFFFNLVIAGKDPVDCPDNDHHNVDVIDGLVLPTIASLAVAARSDGTSSMADVESAAATCAAVTRQSVVLERAAAAWGGFVGRLFHQQVSLEEGASQVAQRLGLPAPRPGNQMTACYLTSALPALLNNLVQWGGGSNDAQQQKSSPDVWQALLEKANTGGENVHSGACLGAVLGVSQYGGVTDLPDHLRTGLYQYEGLSQEIDAFVEAVLPSPTKDV